MRIVLRGKHWDLQFTRDLSRANDGECDAPDTPCKQICVREGLAPQRELEVLIHEMLHACHWDLDESVITQTADDISRTLFRLGYRR